MSKSVLRAYLPENLLFLFRTVLSMKPGEGTATQSAAAADAVEAWLLQPENIELIRQHNLDTLLSSNNLELPPAIADAVSRS